MPALILKPGREKTILRQHPWIYSGAVSEIDGEPAIGETVQVKRSDRSFLAWGAYSPMSKIIARIWSWNEKESVNRAFLKKRIQTAINQRETILAHRHTNAVRLIYAESDYMPGLILDRYDDGIVMQVLSAGIEYWKEDIVDIIFDLLSINWIFERSDTKNRQLEGLKNQRKLWINNSDKTTGNIPENLVIHENGIRYYVDVESGQKTGFFIDQRENRKIVRNFVYQRNVLDCFCYTGGFTLNSLKGGAESVTSIDESNSSLDILKKNLRLNNFSEKRVSTKKDDVFLALRKYRDEGRKFDVIILDPPKFSPTAALAQRAAKGYKDINLLAMKLLNDGGTLITFSCSGGISYEFFLKIIADAAVDANKNAKILQRMHQGQDHPVILSYPEGNYLKGLVLQIT